MRANGFKLNENKTEFIVFSRNKDPTSITVTVGTQSIDSQHTVKILVVTFDNNMPFENHVSNICRSIPMNIRKIRQIRKYFTYEALVQCTVRLEQFILWVTIKYYKETAASPECRSTIHRKDITTRINFTYTHRSSLASCHKAMPI